MGGGELFEKVSKNVVFKETGMKFNRFISNDKK